MYMTAESCFLLFIYIMMSNLEKPGLPLVRSNSKPRNRYPRPGITRHCSHQRYCFLRFLCVPWFRSISRRLSRFEKFVAVSIRRTHSRAQQLAPRHHRRQSSLRSGRGSFGRLLLVVSLGAKSISTRSEKKRPNEFLRIRKKPEITNGW